MYSFVVTLLMNNVHNDIQFIIYIINYMIFSTQVLGIALKVYLVETRA